MSTSIYICYVSIFTNWFRLYKKVKTNSSTLNTCCHQSCLFPFFRFVYRLKEHMFKRLLACQQNASKQPGVGETVVENLLQGYTQAQDCTLTTL